MSGVEMKKVVLLVLAVLLRLQSAEAQAVFPNWDGFLQPVSFGKPFLSEVHSYTTKIDFGYSQLTKDYNLSSDPESDRMRDFKIFVNVDLGVDIPLYAISFGTWKAALTLPLSVHVFEDMFDETTAPVINTDYRFGSPELKAIFYLGDGFFKNVSVSWLPIFHECTHLGDEVTIYRKDLDLPITRINVSYEFTQLQIALNDPDGHKDTRHSFKIGGLYRLSSRGYGWYSIRPEEGVNVDDLGLETSDIRFEYWFQYQMQRTDGFLANERAMNVFSLELRNRVRYGVPVFRWENDAWNATGQEEQGMWCVNAYLGYRFFPQGGRDQSLGAYFHFYYGVNPYGQLRNIYGYKYFGLSLVYEPW